jgi:hypothetical protein
MSQRPLTRVLRGSPAVVHLKRKEMLEAGAVHNVPIEVLYTGGSIDASLR